ncbi:hypothetical protein [Bacillus badius]|uniref:Uncharacterized protein n=1 Tax=Bacillus badius TaxID=1455 RepID=A0ABR5AQ56_BACBA|nr:hypothetical protein [Bacillus badius]KIL75876.1 hypothetical protein SD77_2716 [Bacillus badius]MED4717034.1 hypothetical protein [Bacillus badius]
MANETHRLMANHARLSFSSFYFKQAVGHPGISIQTLAEKAVLAESVCFHPYQPVLEKKKEGPTCNGPQTSHHQSNDQRQELLIVKKSL